MESSKTDLIDDANRRISIFNATEEIGDVDMYYVPANPTQEYIDQMMSDISWVVEETNISTNTGPVIYHRYVDVYRQLQRVSESLSFPDDMIIA